MSSESSRSKKITPPDSKAVLLENTESQISKETPLR